MTQDLADAAQALLDRHRGVNRGGFSSTALPDVAFFWTDRPSPREPLSYDPGLAVILSGTKTGYLDGQRFEYGEGRYLAVGLPVVFECETHASADAPLFGLFLRFRPEELLDLKDLLEQTSVARLPKASSLGVEPLPVGPKMEGAITRLVRQLCQPHEAAALGPGTLREIFFHALQDSHGRVLLSLTQLSRPEARIADLLRRIEARGGPIGSVDEMARDAGMSPASLHRHFRSVTGYPPLQYFKRQRLMRARQLLAGEHNSVAQAAHAVGYGSAAQFSRDFRKLFGYPPSSARSM
ncbi:MAG: AraC family transcriptional regulator N-terminal domain-containing protein [Pseudomonadota bacterium]